MKLLFAALFFLLAVICTTTMARPQYKDIDYKLYNDDDGIAVDSIYETVSVEPPEPKEHHHHHKKMAKSNRLDRLKRFLEGYDRL